METSIQSKFFPLRPLGSFQVIFSVAALHLHLRTRGRILEIFVLELANLRGPERRWFLHPSDSHRENILNVASEHVMLSGGVCLACVPPLPNNSPDRAWPDSTPLSVAIYVVCRVGSNAPSPEFLHRDATKVHIIRRRCPVSWTLLVVIIPFEPSPRPLLFYLYKGVALWCEGPRSPYFTFYQACLYVDGAVSSLVFV